jgi:hypothetical protein
MKILLLLILFFTAGNLYSQDFQVKITYKEDENSKDSRIEIVTISVDRLNAVRSTKSTTDEGGLEMNEKITLGEDDLSKIKTLAEELWLMEENTLVHITPFEYRSINISLVNKEDKKILHFLGSFRETDNSEYYQKLYKFYKEVEGLLKSK